MANKFENGLATTRWLLLPFCISLIVELAMLVVRVVEDTVTFASSLGAQTDESAILQVLGIIDLTLTGSLVLIVSLVTYSLFVHPVDVKANEGWPSWLAHVDFAELKRKLLAAIVAISAIKLLEVFMDVEHKSAQSIEWMLAIHLVFVLSTLLMAVSDKIGANAPKET
jgi:uncharacterized protein (TIGR00645 family)